MLVGLGLGPGDPELLTLRATRLLREAAAVFVPGEMARNLVAPYREAEVLDFPMTSDGAEVHRRMEANADRIAQVARDRLVVFGLLGDPNFFSTFSRLVGVMRERHPAVVCSTEPGVSAITACAAIAGFSMGDGFVVTDGSPVRTAIHLKVRRPRETAEELRKEGYREFVLMERIFLPDMQVYRGEDLPEESGYFSILVARR